MSQRGLSAGVLRRAHVAGTQHQPTEHAAQFKGRRGGAADAALFAVVATRPGESGRFYRSATKNDLKATKLAADRQRQIESDPRKARESFPEETLPYLRSIFNINLLDVNQWKDLFSPRQLITIATLHKALVSAHRRIQNESEKGLADAIATCLALAIDRQADYTTSLCRWHLTGELIGNTFGRQALGIIWDFAEVCPFANGSGTFEARIRGLQVFVAKSRRRICP